MSTPAETVHTIWRHSGSGCPYLEAPVAAPVKVRGAVGAKRLHTTRQAPTRRLTGMGDICHASQCRQAIVLASAGQSLAPVTQGRPE
jgi:hypothetical protein